MFRKRKQPEVSDEQDTIEIDQIVSEPEEPEQPAKMKYLDSTQMWSPVKDIKDGIVITKDGRYVQILELRAAYRRKGITRRNKSLVDPAAPWRFKEMPILGDLYKELQLLPGAERLLSALYMFVEGSARSFNSPTNVNLDNPYVVIDVSECTKELLPVAIFIATDFVSDLVKADRTKKKAVIWDELHRLVGPGGTEDAAEYVMQCWKVFRGYRAICIAATQNSTDFLSSKNGDFGRNILDASKLKVLMKVENMDALALANILNLSSNETDWLQYFDRGEALLIANRNHARIKVVASETEDMLITTDPEQLERIKQQILQE